jgi:hypothetical protein
LRIIRRPQHEAAQTSPPVFGNETLDKIYSNVSQIGAAMQGLGGHGLISSWPSIAPIPPLHAPAQNVPDRVGHAAFQRADIAPAGMREWLRRIRRGGPMQVTKQVRPAVRPPIRRRRGAAGMSWTDKFAICWTGRRGCRPPAPASLNPALSPAWAGLKIPG